MKKIRTTIAAIVALAVCVGAPLFAADTAAAITPDSKPNVQAGSGIPATGWYGPGEDGGTGYFNPAVSGEYDPYPFYNIVGGESFGALYEYSLPNQNESPFNPQAALTRHGVNAPRMGGLSFKKKVAQIVPARSLQNQPPAAD